MKKIPMRTCAVTKEKLEKRDLNDVLTIADEKSKKRGGFEEKIFLEKVIESK